MFLKKLIKNKIFYNYKYYKIQNELYKNIKCKKN